MIVINIITAIIALAIGTYTDLKTREVPDWLNYSLIAFSFGSAIIYSLVNSSFTPFLYALAGFAVCLILALIFFYTGQWGGGDAKMLMGLGALIGLNFHSRIPDLVVFIFNIVFIGAIYGMIWSIVLGIINRKVFIKEFKKKIGTKMMIWIRTVILIVCVLGLISLFLVPLLYKFIIFIFVFLLFFMFYIWIFIKSIEKVSMIKIMPVEKVTEGDWIVDDVVINKKRICGPKDLGISKEQIATLLSLKKKKKISKIKIKVGMPFVPSFLISYLVTIIFGNWLVLLLF